ncbi:acyl-CoA dehydrogenase family protein [Sandaracinobacter sp. RS1-74]|uniref:acyl-CoA dehydrogenase family protein n=1 Tax=Sandaracinobacteroides sayramensis TaxID=2913411 RepID=UPI001EDBD16D|nr:acyl-CoA dehydrogenase family protein [Sandaracinobacteroides sayramensis]MCG2842434.1 acyl-CoA dehydrogenase family protein [Sandaracinobacteroides sayramensis]
MTVIDLPGRRTAPPAYEELAARFRPVFQRIADGAVEREIERKLPYGEAKALREAGFGAIRIPVAEGGSGATLPQLFRLLVELGEADSNLVQIFRAHFAFVEIRLNSDDTAARERWFPRIVAGQTVGAAMAERTTATETTLDLRRDGDRWLLDGEKYYCTGTLYADWVSAAAKEGEERVSVLVPTDAPGVSLIDDWDGFGQRLTASGTTRFENVEVFEENFLRRFNPGEYRADSYISAFYQQFHLAALAGIARAVKRDAIAFVHGKTRQFGVPGLSEPRKDPLVQRVIGRIASQVFAAEAIVDSVSESLQAAHEAYLAGADLNEPLAETDRRSYQGQQVLIELVPQVATLLFEVGGASAAQESRRLDRHWRNARVLASHNPAIARERVLGDHYLNGIDFRDEWAKAWKKDGASADSADAAATPEAVREPVAQAG